MMFSRIFILKTLFFISLSLSAFLASAQNTCTYQLQLLDSFGDGWGASFVAIQLNGAVTNYTLGDGDDDETTQLIEFLVKTGDSLSVRYGTDGTPTFQNEISYRLLDADGLIVVEEGPSPAAGLILEQVITCPTCSALDRENIRLENIAATSVDLAWEIEEGEQMLLRIEAEGLATNTEQLFSGDRATVTNLRENTNYKFYLSRVCIEDERSHAIGPFEFRTPLLSDPDTCFYTLRLLDFFGDGWNGSFLSISINDNSTDYTLLNGAAEIVAIPALSNLPLEVRYSRGSFDGEISYILEDEVGNTILSDGPSPMTGLVLSTIACPSCPVPLNPSTNPFASSATLSWESHKNVLNYVLEYGAAGFKLGEGTEVITESNTLQLTNLEENTMYDYYLYSACAAGDTSLQTTGPFRFKTLFKKDVGIQEIIMPQTTCGLGVSELITIELKNFGANPQSLIPYEFSINAINGGVPIPTDGFFTGILSKDSSTIIEFETPANLMNTGVYEIAVWTALAGDNNPMNDTAKVQIANLPTIQTYPYAENFSKGNGGWTIATNSENSSWEFGIPMEASLPRLFNTTTVWATNLTGAANADERSYLLSPCMDFSSLTTDPLIAFRYFMDVPEDSEANAALEMSINGGRWQVVGQGETDFHWYNNDAQTAWTEDASSGTWVYAEQKLEAAAGQADIRLRFVYESAATDTIGFGFGVDDIHIFEATKINAVASAVTNSARMGCGNAADQVRLVIRNSGTDTLRQLTLGYQVNEGAIIQEQIDTILLPTSSLTYTFETPFSSETIQNYRLQAWVEVAEDNTPISDTTYFFFDIFPPLPLPLIEDFNDEIIEEGWQLLQGSPSLTEPEDHNNTTAILSDNMWFGNSISQFSTTTYGPLNEGDSLTFTYRLAEWADATTPLELTTDTLTVGISTDCGASFMPLYTIHQGNHLPTAEFTKVTIPLTDFVGAGVSFSFLMQWGAGDYWWDIDDIMVLSCPSSLALTATVIAATGEEEADGSILISPTQGSGSYSYDWQDIEMTTDSVGGLAQGTYTVSVTDARLGCMDSITVAVGVLSTTISDIPIISSLTIYPNPTAQSAQLDLQLNTPTDITIDVFNVVGQPIHTFELPATSVVRQDIGIGSLPKGIYWIRIRVGERYVDRKILKVG